MYDYNRALAMYPFVIAMRLFKAFAAQPRLSLVTETLKIAAVDILHFFVVFAAIFSALSAVGMCLFGYHDEDFSTFGRASITSFQVLLGEYDWKSLRNVGLLYANVWVVIFNVLIYVFFITSS